MAGLIYIYYILLLFAYIVSIPFLILFAFLPKYRQSIPSRFFLINNPPFKNNTYWFHSCSLGETRSLAPIINGLDKVNISVVTNTGFKEANKYKNAQVRYLPFEIFLPFWIKPCKCLVVMEAELWLMLFFAAKKRCRKTILINARISDKSYSKYMQFKWFYKIIFKYVDQVFAQSEKDKKRLESLGAKNVSVAGNIKTLGSFNITKAYRKKTHKKLIVAGSTHKKEEEMILSSVDFDKYSLVVVPRHPERFEEVWNLILSFSKKHKLKPTRLNQNIEGDIILADVMGELINLYSIADVVILGGAFTEVGGHNPIEVAFFNKPLISGKYIFNQESLFEQIKNYYLTDEHHLKNLLNQDLKPSSIKKTGSMDEIMKAIF
jgi:3-deoxy-D-manno-octulosonic-acid transferase